MAQHMVRKLYLITLPVGAKEKVDHVPQSRVSEKQTASPYALLWRQQ